MRSSLIFAVFIAAAAANAMLAEVEFVGANLARVCNTTDTLRDILAHTLGISNNSIHISSCRSSTVRYNLTGVPQAILDMNLVSYNTHIIQSPLIIDYCKYVGCTGIVSAAPFELLRTFTAIVTDTTADAQPPARIDALAALFGMWLLWL